MSEITPRELAAVQERLQAVLKKVKQLTKREKWPPGFLSQKELLRKELRAIAIRVKGLADKLEEEGDDEDDEEG